MKNIDFAKIVKIEDFQKIYNKNDKLIKSKCLKDDFVKENAQIVDLNMDKYIKNYSNCNYDKISKNLIKDGYWTDGLSFIAYNTTNNKIDSVSLGIEEVDNVKIVSIKEFVDILKNVTATKIIKNPSEEKLYKDNFVKIFKHLKNNEYKN